MKTSITFTVALALMASLGAQAQIAQPKLETGDTWSYTATDQLKKEGSQFKITVLGKTDTGYQVKTETGNVEIYPEHSVLSANLAPCDDRQACDDSKYLTALRFPLSPGQKYKIAGYTAPGRPTNIDSGECEVQEAESVTVAAGKFDAVRVKCSGWWRHPLFGMRGPFEQVYWYSPEVRQVIKRTQTTRNAAGNMLLWFTLELSSTNVSTAK